MEGRILIVEDEPIVALDLKQELELLGYEVVGVAESAEEALASVEMCRPDLALLDIRIAGTMDGIQTARLLRRWFDLGVVFLTAHSDEATLARAALELPYGYLTKPFQTAELKATLRMAVHKLRVEAKEAAAHEEVVTALDWMKEGVLLVGIDGLVSFMNHEAEVLTGMTAGGARGRWLSDVLRIDHEHEDRLPGFGSEPAFRAEVFGCSLRQEGGAKLPVDLNIAPVENCDGARTGMVVTVRNATERLRCGSVVEAVGDQSGFDRSLTAMMHVDSFGRITRVDLALLEQSDIAPDLIVGRSITALKLDPDPRISVDLVNKLLRDGPVVKSDRPMLSS